MKYKAVDELPAMGKTHSTLKVHMSSNNDKVLVLAMPHIKTIEEKVKLAYRLRDETFGYDKDIVAIHSDSSLGDVVSNIISTVSKPNVGILFITHSGYLKAVDSLAELDNVDVDIVVDEETEAIVDTLLDLNINTWEHLILPNIQVQEVTTQYLLNMADLSGHKNLDNFYEVSLKEGLDVNRIIDEGSDSSLVSFWRVLGNKNFTTLIPRSILLQVDAEVVDSARDEDEKVQLRATSIVDGGMYTKTNPTFMAAFFTNTIFYNILKQQGVEFEFIRPPEVKPRDNKNRTIHIKYYVNGKDTLTQKLLKQSNNLKKIQDVISSDIDNTNEVYYILNKRMETKDFFQSKGNYTLASKFEGSSRYIHCNTSVFLAAYNSNPNINKIHKELGIKPNMVNSSRNTIKLGQFMRGVNRITDSSDSMWEEDFTIYVPTKDMANFLVTNNFRDYPNVTVEALPIPELTLGNTRQERDKEAAKNWQRLLRIKEAYVSVYDVYPSNNTLKDLDRLFFSCGGGFNYKKSFEWSIGKKPKRLDMVSSKALEIHNKVSTYMTANFGELIESLQKVIVVLLESTTSCIEDSQDNRLPIHCSDGMYYVLTSDRERIGVEYNSTKHRVVA